MIPGVNPFDYDVEPLRGEDVQPAIEEVEQQRDPSHECCECGNKQYIDDFHRRAPNYCERCGSIEIFWRIDRKR